MTRRRLSVIVNGTAYAVQIISEHPTDREVRKQLREHDERNQLIVLLAETLKNATEAEKRETILKEKLDQCDKRDHLRREIVMRQLKEAGATQNQVDDALEACDRGNLSVFDLLSAACGTYEAPKTEGETKA